MSSSATRARRRIPNACRICRQRKVKCDGKSPCTNCVSRGNDCLFDAVEKKVVVLEKHFRALQRRASDRVTLPETPVEILSPEQQHVAGANDVVASDGHSSVQTEVQPPESLEETRASTEKRLRYSPWTYLEAAESALAGQDIHQVAVPQPDRSRTLVIHDQHHDTTQDRIPPIEVIVHLIHVVDFHLNRVLFFFNPLVLLARFSSTSTISPTTGTGNHPRTITHAQLRTIISLGKLCREKDGLRSSAPGLHDFWAAEAAVPTDSELLKEPVIALETLCMLSYYAQAIERQDLAHSFIGRALRILQVVRLFHTANDSIEDREHMLKLDRTVEILEIRISASVGHNSHNINYASGRLASHANTSPQLAILNQAKDVALALQEASRSFHISMKASLGIGKGLDSMSHMNVDPASALEMLRGLGDIGSRMALIPSQRNLADDGPVVTESSLRQLHLWFCHCVLVITLPSLLLDVNRHQSTFAPARAKLKILTETCAKYAYLVLKLLSFTHEHGFLESFSPFNLELLTLASIALIFTNAITEPTTKPSSGDPIDQARLLLDSMSECGYKSASTVVNRLDHILAKVRLQRPLESTRLDPSLSSFDGRLLGKDMLELSEVSQSQLGSQGQHPHEHGHIYEAHVDGNLPLLQGGPLLNTLVPSDDDFTFDMEDLQWLDAVQ